MSDLRTLADKLKAAPSVSDPSGMMDKLVMVTDGSGAIAKVPVSLFARTTTMRLRYGEVLRISNISSAFITCRGTIAGRAALIWFSIYGSGTPVRSLYKSLYNNGYNMYINGSSEDACLYVTSDSEQNDYVAVTGLFGESPIIEKVAALPSDATPMTFT